MRGSDALSADDRGFGKTFGKSGNPRSVPTTGNLGDLLNQPGISKAELQAMLNDQLAQARGARLVPPRKKPKADAKGKAGKQHQLDKSSVGEKAEVGKTRPAGKKRKSGKQLRPKTKSRPVKQTRAGYAIRRASFPPIGQPLAGRAPGIRSVAEHQALHPEADPPTAPHLVANAPRDGAAAEERSANARAKAELARYLERLERGLLSRTPE